MSYHQNTASEATVNGHGPLPPINCPDCGERMFDDRDGMTGAPYFCANGHRAVLMYIKKPGRVESLCTPPNARPGAPVEKP